MAKNYHDTPFNDYFNLLDDIDKGKKDSKEYGSFLILGLLEELGEMARAYQAKHGRKKTNIAAQQDETYEQELGDILVAIFRFARIKNINLHDRIMYSLEKVKKRKKAPKK
jgi:NTP pyrophosphatase (non-canonical NTP hydrolase)